jgi:hypothetical protein
MLIDFHSDCGFSCRVNAQPIRMRLGFELMVGFSLPVDAPNVRTLLTARQCGLYKSVWT